MANTKYTPEEHNKLMERVFNGSIKATYELDRHVNDCEEFVKDSPVYCCEVTSLPITKLKDFEELNDVIKQHVKSATRLFVFHSDNTYHIRFAFSTGKNGAGNWVRDDLFTALQVLQDLREMTKSAEFIRMHHDIPDDVSYWGVACEV